MRRPLFLSTLLFAGLVLGGCSGDDGGGSAEQSAADTTTTAVAVTSGAEDLDAFCAGFAELSEGRVAGDPSRLDLGDGSAEDAAAAYAAQRATVVEIAAAAPEEVRDNAETYVELIDARASFAASGPGEGLTPEEQTGFAEEHMAQQQEVNELLDYARDTCPDFA